MTIRQTTPAPITSRAAPLMWQLQSVEELKSSVADGAVLSGELRLGVTPGVGDLALGKPIGALRRNFPDLALQLQSRWSNELLPDLRNGLLDAAAVLLPAGREPPADLVGRCIGGDEVKVVAARRLRLPARLRLADLAGQAWVLSPQGCYYHNSIRRAMRRADLPFRVVVDLFGPDLQLALVAEGIGLGLLPRRIIARSRHRSRLTVLDVSDFRIKVEVWLLHRPQLGRLGPAVDCFREALMEGLTAGGPGRAELKCRCQFLAIVRPSRLVNAWATSRESSSAPSLFRWT